ncbi:syndecan-2 [Echinops telfairi]|uniref:Syndecan-2 n=1 Tax=Echinops telfairi TaxID=9371 RepID=A0AC55CUQ1_ECHTE|nr:syndecan-2 [Echinops telfairi]
MRAQVELAPPLVQRLGLASELLKLWAVEAVWCKHSTCACEGFFLFPWAGLRSWCPRWSLVNAGGLLVSCHEETRVRAELTSDKDMYLDNSSMEEASGVYPIDDDDYASASGSAAQTQSPEEIDKENVHMSDSERKVDPAEEDTNVYTEKHSDNLFKRKEVLAAVIAGGVIGFLFAISLILLLVYRMRKKDEGSYDLGERKPSSAAYQKAPTKEFYA